MKLGEHSLARGESQGTRGVRRPAMVGREDDVAHLSHLIGEDGIRLVTLTGPGGVGKTRLARALADDPKDCFPDGAAFVSLAALDDPGLVISSIAGALGLREEGDNALLDGIVAELAGLELLLVLDNFEHVLDAAPVVGALLERCPTLTILATSRSSLRLTDEYEYGVEPLALPPERVDDLTAFAGNPAVALFAQRASMVVPGFEVSDSNADDVGAICRQLDGVPLALQLAASSLKLLTPAQLRERLDHPLDVLVGGPRDTPTRQQTLRRTLEWSHELLAPSEQRALRRLSVFAGGCTPVAAEAIAGFGGVAGAQVLADLVALVDQSLIRRRPAPGAEARLVLLQTVRAFALERLAESGEEEAIRAAHADYFAALAQAAEPEFRFSPNGEALDRIDEEHDNLRSALRWAIDTGAAAHAVSLAATLSHFWLVRGYLTEGRQWLEQVLALDPAAVPVGVRVRALCGAAQLAHFQNAYDVAIDVYEQALALARAVGDRAGVLIVLSGLATTVGRHRDPAAAEAMFREALDIAVEPAFGARVPALRLGLASILWYRGDGDQAAPLLRECLREAEALGLDYEAAGASHILGWLAIDSDPELARGHLEAAMAAFRDMRDRWGVARCRLGLGYEAAAAGDHRRSRAHFAEGIHIIGELGHKLIMCACIGGFAIAAQRDGRHERALILLGAATANRRVLNGRHSQLVQAAQDRAEAEARAALGNAADHAFATGQALTLNEARALAERELAHAESGPAAELTLAERRVLRLVAHGLTNADVAAELVLSERTVHAHLRTIYRKLGVGNRADASTVAREAGLVDELAD